MTVRERFDRLKDCVEERRSLEHAQLQDLIEARGAEHLARRVMGLRDAVGVKDNLIAALKLLYGFRVFLLGKDAQR